MNEGNPARDAWAAAIELLRAEGNLSAPQFAFLRMAHPLATVDDIFMIAVGSEYVKNWIEENAADPMREKLVAILGREVRLITSIDPSLTETSQPPTNPATSAQKSTQSTPASSTLSGDTPIPHYGAHYPTSQQHVPQTTPSAASAPGTVPSSLSFTSAATPTYGANSSEYSDTLRDLVASSLPPSPTLPSENTSAVETFSAQYVRRAVEADNTREILSPFGEADEAFAFLDEAALVDLESAEPSPELKERARKARLNIRYTFDNFVIGQSNQFATATSLAVAESPGTTYNPLFLYSDSGMGKTHLMHAIGNYALRLFPDIKVHYTSAEEFTNAFINAIRDGKQAEFKNHYRGADILLIDDIQFIGGDKIMEEFFHTFNALTNANKQIVITSDVAPNLLNGFQDRLVSRFISGISASIDHPNLETRIAILDKKAVAAGISVPRDVQEYIASNITTNIREMEGALTRVTAFAGLNRQPVDLALAEVTLKDLIDNPDDRDIPASLIMGQVADYFGINIEDLTAADRTRSVATARQVAMYICRTMTELSLPKIGKIFGGRDHSTVLHAYQKIEKQMSEHQTTFNQVSELTSRIHQAARYRE